LLLVSSSRFATGGPLGSRSLSRGSIVPNRPLMDPEAAPPMSPQRLRIADCRFRPPPAERRSEHAAHWAGRRGR
jgi:hypothetical protein